MPPPTPHPQAVFLPTPCPALPLRCLPPILCSSSPCCPTHPRPPCPRCQGTPTPSTLRRLAGGSQGGHAPGLRGWRGKRVREKANKVGVCKQNCGKLLVAVREVMHLGCRVGSALFWWRHMHGPGCCSVSPSQQFTPSPTPFTLTGQPLNSRRLRAGRCCRGLSFSSALKLALPARSRCLGEEAAV